MKSSFSKRWRTQDTSSIRGKFAGTLALAALALAATNSWGQVLTNGDFQTAPLTSSGEFQISNTTNQWVAYAGQYTLEVSGPSGDSYDYYAKHRTTGGGQDEKLVQFIDAIGISGKLALNLQYIYQSSTQAQSNPQGVVSLIGIDADRMYSMYGGLGTDGYPGGPEFGVAPPDTLLAQKVLPFSSDWAQAVTLVANVPPGVYDYIGVVVQSGCYKASETTECDTLRGTDNFVLVIDEEGPYTKHVQGIPNAAIFNTPFEITAVVDDTEKGNSTIDSAEYRILQHGVEVVPWTFMDPADGALDKPFEDVKAMHPGLPVGEYQMCVRGTDVALNVGAETCSNFVTYSPISESGLNIPISNECAIFYTVENPGAENEITSLHYGEDIVFDTNLRIDTKLNISGSGNVTFNSATKANGQGTGVTSGILYNFMLNSVLRAKTDLANYDPSTYSFDVRAKIVGQAQDVDGYGILNGAQNNAEIFFKLRLHYVGGYLTQEAYDFGVECAGDPWSNLMENWNTETREPVGRGFGKETNKYGWTGVDFEGGLIVGTKNAYYNPFLYGLGDGGVLSACYASRPPAYPEIYWRFVCLEVGGFNQTDVWRSDGAELWRFDYNKKRWQQVYDAVPRTVPEHGGTEFVQGFRDSVVHNGKLYMAADLGAFISGVSFANQYTYPGVALLVSEDGVNFELVENCPTSSGDLCESQVRNPPAVPDNNLSIRALASYGGKLYIGTFNGAGGQLWSYDDVTGVFTKVWQAGTDIPLIGELEPYNGKLYIGVGGELTTDSFPDNNYIYVCEKCSDATDIKPVADLPDIDPETFWVIKLFATQGRLFAGTVNFVNGFSMLSYDSTASIVPFDMIADGPREGGFFNSSNYYLWSMSEVNGRLVIGTFNPDDQNGTARGSAELWYSDDGINWVQYPLPIGWSLVGYGVRDLVTGDDGKTLFLLSATNMIAPELGDAANPLAAGLEVWAIRDTKIASPSEGPSKGKGKKK